MMQEAWILIFLMFSGEEVIQPIFYPTEEACFEAFVDATLDNGHKSEEWWANRPRGATCDPVGTQEMLRQIYGR